jgi:gluconate 5-dehydrogenase
MRVWVPTARAAADDWGKHGVTVNCLAPGWFRTDQNSVMYEDREWVEYLTERIPLKRPGQAHDLDAAVVFLAAESSRYVTGQTLLVDGGISVGAMRALPSTASAKSTKSDSIPKSNRVPK